MEMFFCLIFFVELAVSNTVGSGIGSSGVGLDVASGVSFGVGLGVASDFGILSQFFVGHILF